VSAPDERPLAGRCALVTGASRRLGRAIAERLARAGASVAVHYRRDAAGARETAAHVEGFGGRSVTLAADLADAAASARLVEEAERSLGPLDLLVHNAAIFERTPVETTTSEDFDRIVATNARSTYALALAAGRRMKARGRGAIVNLACVSGLRPWKGYLAYSASKAAVISLTQGFAKALAPEVRVNAVAPGPILPAAGSGAEQDRRAVEATLLERWGAPADVAEAVLFLATAPWMTGVILPVDGGRSVN
jgi:pteridine reductase